MTRAFEAQTGIATDYVAMTSGEALARLFATSIHPRFSVWWGGSAEALIMASDGGLLEPYESPTAPLITSQCRRILNQTWIGVYVGVLGFCSNSAALSELGIEPPTSWESLLNPELQGQIVLGHPATSSAPYMALWTQVVLRANALERTELKARGLPDEAIAGIIAAGTATGAGFDLFGFPSDQAIDEAMSYFAALDKNVMSYPSTWTTATRMVAEGQAGVTVAFSYDCVNFRQASQADEMAITFPAEGAGYGVAGMAIVADAPQPGAARQWYDWALTPAAQAILQTVGGFYLPANGRVSVQEIGASLNDINLIRYDCDLADLMRVELLERFETVIHPPD